MAMNMQLVANSTSQIKRSWLLVIGLNLLLVAHLLVQILSTSSGFDTFSTLKLWIGIIVAPGFVAVSLGLARQENLRNRVEPFHALFVLGSITFLFVLALIPVPPESFPHLAHAHTLLTFTVTLLVFHNALFDGSFSLRRPRVWLFVMIVAVIVIIFIRVYGLSVYPFVDVQDEAWTTAWTLSFLRTGHFGDTTLGGLGDAYYAYPRFYVLMAMWIRAFGVGLWQERLLGFLLIFPVIGFTALTARNWYGTRAAIFTSVAMFASAVLMSAARVRHDIGLTLCLAISLWLHTVALKRPVALLHLLAGAFIGWGMFSHYHAAGFGVAMLLGLYLPRYIAQLRRATHWRERLPETGAILYGIGGLLGGLTVLFLQMIPDDLPGWLWTLSHQSLYSENSGQFFIAFIGNFMNIGFFSIFELLLVAGGVFTAFRRRGQHDISLLTIMFAAHLLLAVMASGAIYYYILPLTPIYGILVGTLFVRKQEQPEPLLAFRREEIVTFALVLMPLLGATITRPLQALLNGESLNPPPPPAVEWVMENVPRDAVVVGDMYYYFWLNDYDFVSHLVPEYLYPENIERLPTLESVWAEVDMDVLIIDPSFDRSYTKYFQPLLATGLVDANYTIAAEFPNGSTTTIVYERRDAPE